MMKKETVYSGFDIYYNDEICIAEINMKMINMGIDKNLWCPADPTDTTVSESLRPKVPITVRNNGTAPIWIQLKPNGFLEVLSTRDWDSSKIIPLKATMTWRRQ